MPLCQSHRLCGSPLSPSRKSKTSQNTGACAAWTRHPPAATSAVRGSCPHSRWAVRQEVDLALEGTARQDDGNDVSPLALRRIDGVRAAPMFRPLIMLLSVAPCTPLRVRRTCQHGAGLFPRMACLATFDAVHHALGRVHTCGEIAFRQVQIKIHQKLGSAVAAAYQPSGRKKLRQRRRTRRLPLRPLPTYHKLAACSSRKESA